jgi:glucose-1-phosphate thymidylyltransferase
MPEGSQPVAAHMEIAKALILAGSGEHLFPVANRPILFHNLEGLRSAGVREVAILADPATGVALESAVEHGGRWGMDVRYAEWDPTEGLGDALDAGSDFLEGEPVLVQRAEALLRERLDDHIVAFARERLDALALRLPPGGAGAADALTPGYLLSARAVSILRETRALNPVAGVRARGGHVRVQDVDGCLACHGDVASLLESNRRMLERLRPIADPSRFEQCTIQGPVDVDPTADIRRSLLRGPVIIGPGARVTDAYIGPYSSIGAGVVIEGAEIEHSIVLSEAELRFIGTRVESSVIGRGARVVRGFDLPGAIRLAIGDGAEVVLR